MGRMYNEKRGRLRGNGGDPFVAGVRVMLTTFNLGSSVGATWRAEQKWQVLSVSLIANAVPFFLTYPLSRNNALKPFNLFLATYSLATPFVSAYIGYELDKILNIRKVNKIAYTPQVYIARKKFLVGVSFLF